MIIRFDTDGRKYLYDIIDIKKKRSTPYEQEGEVFQVRFSDC